MLIWELHQISKNVIQIVCNFIRKVSSIEVDPVVELFWGADFLTLFTHAVRRVRDDRIKPTVVYPSPGIDVIINYLIYRYFQLRDIYEGWQNHVIFVDVKKK